MVTIMQIVCLPSVRSEEASQEGYEGFLIDPPLSTLEGLGSVLPLTISDIKSAIEEGTT